MRRAAGLAVALAVLSSSCSTKVDPTNPWDADTPGPQQQKARINGVVRLGGAPTAFVQVRLKQNGASVDQAVTLADGTFVFGNLQPGTYVVETERTGYQKYVYPVALAAGQSASLDADLVALAGVQGGTLAGKALLQDQSTHGGILVEVRAHGGTTATYTGITSSEGDYQIPVAEGSYDLKFVREDFQSSTKDDVAVAAGQLSAVPQVLLAVNPASLNGTVVGETLAGTLAPLDLADITLENAFSIKSSNGSWGFNNIVPGSYLVRATKAGYEEASVPVIDLKGGTTRTLADPFVLRLSRGGITGTVQLADSADASGAVVEATGTGVATVTGASGAFTLTGLVEGVYEVSVRKDGYAPAVRAGITVAAGASTGIGTVTLARQGGAIDIVQGAVTRNRLITVRLNASSATGYRISQDPTFTAAGLGDTLTSPASPRPYGGQGTTHDFTLDDLDGRHEVYVIFYDGTTASSPASASIVLDRTAPQAASVVIESGSGYTRSTVVGLGLSAQDLPPAPNIEVSGLAGAELADNPAFSGSTSITFATSTTWPIGAGDGAKQVWVRFTDKAGNVSDPASATIVLDTVAPSAVAITLSGGATAPAGYTGSPLVAADLSATDANGGTNGQNLQVRISNSSGLGGATLQPFASSVPWFVTAGDGAKTVYVQVVDPAGNASVVANGTITLAATPPSAGSLVVEDGAAATSKTTVNAAVSATGAAQMRFLVNGAVTADWMPYATTASVPLGAVTDGSTVTVAVAFRNVARVEGGGASVNLLVDRTAPTAPAISVNGGAAFTGSTAVTIGASALDAGAGASGLAKVQLSNDGFATSTTVGYATSLPWTLAAGADGARTVSARFLDVAGNVTATVTDGIVLDTTAPAATTLSLAGNPEAPAGFTGTPIVTATLSATDANAGAGNANLEVRLSNDLGFAASTWQPFAASTAWVLAPGDGAKTVYAQFRDAAGNVSSPPASANLTLVATPPSNGAIVVEGGAAATSKNATPLAVTLSATGATQMRLFLNGAAATAWIPYATSTTVPASGLPDEAVAVVSVAFRNGGGVEGGNASTSILVDRRAPTSPSVAVNGGATYARAAAAVLTLSAADAPAAAGGTASGLASVQVSNDGFTTSTTLPYATSIPWTLAAGADGARTVSVRFLDRAGNVSAAATGGITLDTVAPASPSLSLTGNPEAPAGFTGTPVVTATLSATDANAGAGNANLEVRLSNDLGFAASTWQPFAASTAWVLAPGDGAKTVYAQFRDPAGNVSATTSAAITLASTAPSAGSIVVEGGAASTNKSATPLAVTVSAANASLMRFSVNGTPVAAGWIPYATSTTLAAASLPDEATAVLSVSFRNAGGLEGGSASTSILVDRRAPTSPSVTVSGGAAYAASTAVTVSVSALDVPAAPGGVASGLASVQLSNDGFTTSTTFPIADTIAWTLAAGADAGRTVSARFVDRAGNVSAIVSDGITLDTAAPAAGSITLAGNPEATAGSTGTPVVTATLTTSDANGGAGNANLEVQLSNSSGFAGATWQAFTSPMAWVLVPGDGAKTVYARFRDPAGNVSTFVQASITLAATAPTSGSIVVEGGAAATNKSATALNVTVGATGATQMRLSVNGTAGSWIPYATSTTVAASGLADETPAAISVLFRNAGGIEGAAASTSILVDRRAPTSGTVAVNAGASYASSTSVTLAVSAVDAPLTTGSASGLASVQVSNDAFATSQTFAMADTIPWTLAAGADGARTVSVRFVDRAGNVSAVVTDGITLDTALPLPGTMSLSGNPEATAGNTGTPIVSVAFSGPTDANAGTGGVNLEVQLSNSSGFSGATWQPYTTPLAWVLTPGDGTKTVYVRFRDPAGLVSTSIQASINLAATPPSSGTLILASGAAATSVATVSAAVTATSATQMQFFVNGVADGRGWIPYATSTTVALGATPNEATRVVSVTFRNVGGIEGGGTSAAIRYDTVAPRTGSLAISGTLGNGTVSPSLTATPAVVLSTIPFTADTDVAQMAVVQATLSTTACNTMFGTPQWQSSALSLTFVLTGTDGAKRVCLLFRDGAGNFDVNNAVAANITLDTTPPTNPTFVNVTSTTTNAPLAPKTGLPTITAATDTNGVVYQCTGGVSPNYGAQWKDCPTALATPTTLPFAWTLVANSENTLGVRARDAAYNYSPGSFARIVHDDVAPTPPFIVELRSSRDSVTVIWDATADTDVVNYVVYYGNAPGDLTGTGAAQGSSPITVPAAVGQASGSFTLTGLTQGIPYYVAVEAVDAAGNRSGPSGERSAVPNKANPRMLSTFGATPRTTGYRATATKTFAYVGTNQGITQVDITDDVFPAVVGRAFLPDMVPVERAPLAVFDCTKLGVAGHCVVPSGTTLEGDYRNDQDFYRAAAPVVFFPLTGTTTAPVVGLIESILPTRPTHVVTYQANGVTYLLAVDLKGVRAFTVDATNPGLVRQVGSVTHAAPVVEVLAAGMNGSELYVVTRVNPQYFGGPTDVPVVLGYECVDLPADFYPLFAPLELGFGDRVAGNPEPTFSVDGGLFANYVAGGQSRLSSFAPGSVSGATPVSTLVLSAASSSGGYPAALAGGANQLYAWTEGGLGNPTLYQVNRSGLTLALGGTRSVGNEPFAAQVIRTHAPATVLLTLDPYTSDPAVRSVQRWPVSGATISNGTGLFNQIRPEWFAWADHVMYVSQAGFINSVDVSNPYLPKIGNAFTPGAAIGGSFGRLVTHGRYLFAAFSPTILPGSGGVAIFRMTGTGGLQTNGNLLNPAPMRTLSFPVGVYGNDVAVAGRWLFATGTDGGLRVYNLAPTTTLNNPTTSVPTLVTTLAGSYGEIEARKDTSGVTSYEAVVYATVGDTVVTLGWDGAAFTTLNAGVTFASSQAATSLSLAGNYLTVGTPAGSYLFSVSSPAAPGATGAAVYPLAGPTKLQAGYLVGLAPSGDPSGPNYAIRSNGIIDGSLRFSTCTGGSARSIAHDAGLYAASCGKNGIALFSASALEGMKLSKTYDISPNWSLGAAFATDGMIGWFTGPQVWNGSATDFSRFYQANEESAAEGILSTPFNSMSVSGDTLRHGSHMVQADGVLYVAVNRSGFSPYIDAYESTTPYSFINRLTLAGTDQIGAMVSDGEYLYIARNGTNTQVSAIDVRNPNAMTVRATATSVLSRTISTLALSRDRLYAPLYQGAAAVNDILVYDVSTVQSAGTITAATTIAGGAEGSITGVDVVGSTIVFTMDDEIYAAPGYFLAIGTLSSNRDGGAGYTRKPLITVSEPLQSPVIAGDNLYVAANLGLQAWDLRGWWSSGGNIVQGGSVSLADPLRINNPVTLQVEGPFAYLVGGTYRVFDLR
ncbi:MAG: carboxypeptidase regulatory-like domain-containing protein [Anaeromyxobacter sp.]